MAESNGRSGEQDGIMMVRSRDDSSTVGESKWLFLLGWDVFKKYHLGTILGTLQDENIHRFDLPSCVTMAYFSELNTWISKFWVFKTHLKRG